MGIPYHGAGYPIMLIISLVHGKHLDHCISFSRIGLFPDIGIKHPPILVKNPSLDLKIVRSWKLEVGIHEDLFICNTIVRLLSVLTLSELSTSIQ